MVERGLSFVWKLERRSLQILSRRMDALSI